jgi:pSer/pThr/pTyr-binding forkhead associated (FHA) protein
LGEDEATCWLPEVAERPVIGALVRVTNDPNLPQELPIYGPGRGRDKGRSEDHQIPIGRHSKHNTVVINHKYISREHAVIVQKGADLYLRDKASTAGTYLNWKRLKPGVELLLSHNDIVSFGEITYEFLATDNEA